MSKRRKYSAEFKREAVAMVKQPGVTKSQVARELGLNANMLGRWSRELNEAGGRAFGGQGKPRDEELVTLKRELARVKRERDFLKEAAENSIGHCNTSASLSAGDLKSSVFLGL